MDIVERVAKAKARKLMNKKEQLKKAYLMIFDEFALDTKEVAELVDLSIDETYKLLKSCDLLTSELIVDGCSGGNITRKNFPGIPYTWQCWKTYDRITREEAVKLFEDKYQKGVQK